MKEHYNNKNNKNNNNNNIKGLLALFPYKYNGSSYAKS
jgi:hypothetical protein